MVDLRAVRVLEDLVKKLFDETIDPSDYLKRSERGAANGVASLDGSTVVPDAEVSKSSVTQHINDAGTTTADFLSAAEVDIRRNAAVVGLLDFKGGYDAATNTPDLDTSPSGVLKGDTYVVTADGLFFTEQVRIGDQLFAEKDNPTVLADWVRVERNIDLATETVVGLVELAADGESAANVVVQGDDARMSDARTPTAHVHSAADVTTGTLALLRGGTGVSAASAAVAFDALAPTTTKGDIIAHTASGNIRLPVGANDEVLTADSAQASGVKWAAAAGGTPNFDDIYNNSGVNPTITVDNGEVIWTLDGGSIPALSADTAMVWVNSSASTDVIEISLISGTSAECKINCGDSGNEDDGELVWSNQFGRWSIIASGRALITARFNTGVVFNEGNNSGDDLRVESVSDTHSFFLDAGDRNTVLCGASAIPAFQSMVRGVFFGNVVTVPTSNPVGGGFLYVEAGALTWRGPSGNIEVISVA